MVTEYKLLNVTQVADRLGCSRSQIKKMIGLGKFPNAVKTGDYDRAPYMIPLSDVEAYAKTLKPKKNKAG